MSNYLAFATVTEAMRQLVEAGAKEAIGGAHAKVLKPAASMAGSHPAGEENVYAGVYLYQAKPNATWRNADTPTRRADGSVMRTSRAAYDLHFLLTFYGNDGKLEPPRVMGAVLRKLHAHPVLSREMIKDAINAVVDLNASDMDTEVETIKLSINPLNLEELAKLWSVFFQTTYCLSVAYQASVVFIDGQESPRPSLPVRSRNLYVKTFSTPYIETVLAQTTPAEEPSTAHPVVVGDTLVLTGRNLRGDVTRVRIFGMEVTPSEVLPAQVKVKLGVPPFPADTLRAGLVGAQVVQSVNMGTPETPHKGFDSNMAPFILHPVITPGAVTNLLTKTVDGVKFHDANVVLNFSPNVGVKQRVALLLNEFDPPASRQAYAYRFNVPVKPLNPSDISVASLTAKLTNVAEGKYLVRVQVDGAESLLQMNADPNKPKFISPQVAIQ